MTDKTTASQSLEQVTVNLVDAASHALRQASDLTQLSKTDVINRALQLYAYIEQVMHDGGAVFVQSAGSSEPQQIKIF